VKRIVDGVTYNTDTSTILARAEWEDDGRWGVAKQYEGTLYQTRGGAFFLHISSTVERKNPDGEWEEKTKDEFEPLTPEDANEWMQKGDTEIIHNPFDDPPEATAEAEPGATIYIRVPNSLKQRVDEAANKQGLSSNAWVMRCVEKCLQRAPKAGP
jgi:hypothetical protein